MFLFVVCCLLFVDCWLLIAVWNLSLLLVVVRCWLLCVLFAVVRCLVLSLIVRCVSFSGWCSSVFVAGCLFLLVFVVRRGLLVVG